MIRTRAVVVVAVCCALLLGACRKKDKDADEGTSSGATPAATDTAAAATASATATASAAPADTGSAAAPSASAPPADSAATAPVATPGVVTPQRGIEDCCGALLRAEHGRGKAARAAAHRAEEICPGIAVKVRQGLATRAQALTQIRSALVGRPVPPACQN